ncbi:bacteriochlorophyll 4-vinyl reductase [Tropicimonas sp. IMCC34043]|uniref:bacteriochlorophyll 4-vinyl reductase n=1 Tax=Tropicimonas sp. IMCC34043 TaxID=2248760 RepID=UPI00130019D2|nr:bacteriochlorophyll 4-vinyl reductase [Tropicimonas sp. IMCC34043]
MLGAKIGPNAVTQMLGPIEHRCGGETLKRVLAAAGIDQMPDMGGLMDEDPAIRLHETVRQSLPDDAAEIAREAGLRTGEYILANRIPKPVRLLLPWLPARISARLLAKAVSKHAWTFAGSGSFSVESLRPLVFVIEGNPLASHDGSPGGMCYWHQAVFETLFRKLVSRRVQVDELQCCGRGDDCCRFVIFF